jgi:colanic acid biosynthesis glycosyl transferase WcaI
MRILIYSYNYYPEPIGIAPLMTELAEGLVQRGHEVRVVTGMPNYPERLIYSSYRGKIYHRETINGVTVQRCFLWANGPNPGFKDRLLLDASFIVTSLLQLFKGWKPDAIFSTLPPLLACFPVALYAGINRIPVVTNVQDIVSEAAVGADLIGKGGAIARIAGALERFSYSISTRITPIADKFIEKLVEQGVPREKIVHIPNWVDTHSIRPGLRQQTLFRKKHGLEHKFVVLYSGNIARTQGLETAIEAAVHLRQFPDIQMVIVGEHHALDKLRNYCKICGVQNVLLLPFIPREELPDMLAAADVSLVLQKRHVTAFNMPSKIPLLLASGRPIIASVPAGGTAEQAVRISGGGVAVAPETPEALARAILDFYRHPEKADAIARRGRQYALDYYKYEVILDQYEALFAEICEQINPVLARQSANKV